MIEISAGLFSVMALLIIAFVWIHRFFVGNEENLLFVE